MPSEKTALGQAFHIDNSIYEEYLKYQEELQNQEQAKLDRATDLLTQAEQQSNPNWLMDRINQKLANIKSNARGREDAYLALQQDQELDSYFSTFDAKMNILNQMYGYEGTDLSDLANRKISAEDDTNNNWLYRQAVKFERGFESIFRDIGSSINDTLGGMGLTEGSFDYKKRKEHEHLSSLPLSELTAIDNKANLIQQLKTEEESLDVAMNNASGLQLQQLAQQKANIQRQLALITLTPEEQKLVDNNVYSDYRNTLANIDTLNKEQAKWQGGTILSNLDEDIVNDTESYHQYLKDAKARGLDKEYEDAGLDPSLLNLSYAVDKSLQMATNADWARVIGEIAPFMLLELTTGGTATPALLGGGLRGLAKAGTTFLASQARNLSTRQLASWGVLGSDAYSRYNEYISEQYAKDPQGTADKLRAAEGAIAGVISDFFGSKLATGIAGKGFEKMLSKAPERIAKQFADLNKGILLGNELKGASKDFNNAVIRPDLIGDLNAKTGGAFAKNMRELNIASDLSKLNQAERSVNKGVVGKVYNTITAPKRAIEGLNKLDKKLSEVGMAPVRDAGKAGVYLGLENAMSEVSRQYGTGTDIEKMDWDQIAESALSGIGSGALFHYPGIGIHAVGSVAKKASQMGDKEKLIPLNDKALSEFKSRFLDDKDNTVNANSLERAISFTANQKLGLEEEKSKIYQGLVNKIGEKYLDVTKIEDGNKSIITDVSLKTDAFTDPNALAKAQKALESKKKKLSGLDKLITQADKVSTELENLKKVGKINQVNNLDKTTTTKVDGEEITTPKIVTEEGQQIVKDAIKSEDTELINKVKDKYKSLGFTEEETNNIINSYKVDSSTVDFSSEYVEKEDAEKIKEFLSSNRRRDEALNLEYFQGITSVDKDVAKTLAELVKDPTKEDNITAFKKALAKAKNKKNIANKIKFWDSILDRDTIRSKANTGFKAINAESGTVKDVIDLDKKISEEGSNLNIKESDYLDSKHPSDKENRLIESFNFDRSTHTVSPIFKNLPSVLKNVYDKYTVAKSNYDKDSSKTNEEALTEAYDNIYSAVLQFASKEEYKEEYKQFLRKVDRKLKVHHAVSSIDLYKDSKANKKQVENFTKEKKDIHREYLNDFLLANQDKTIESVTKEDFKKYLEDNELLEDENTASQVYDELFEKIQKKIAKNNEIVNVPLTSKEADLDKELNKVVDGVKVSDYYEKGKVTIGGTTFYYAKERKDYSSIKKYNNAYAKLANSNAKTISNDVKEEFKKLSEELFKNPLAKKVFDAFKVTPKDVILKDNDTDDVIHTKLQVINTALMSILEARSNMVNKKNFFKKSSLLLTNRYDIADVRKENKRIEDFVTQIENEERLGESIKTHHMNWIKDYKTTADIEELCCYIYEDLGLDIFNNIANANATQSDVEQVLQANQRYIDVKTSSDLLDIIALHIDSLINRTEDGNIKNIFRGYKYRVTLIKNLINDNRFANNIPFRDGGLVLGQQKNNIKPNKIMDRERQFAGDNLYKFMHNLNLVGIHADSSLNVDDLVKTEFGIYVHRNEANSDLVVESVMALGEASNQLNRELENLLSGTTSLDTVLGTNALQHLLEGLPSERLINSIFSDSKYNKTDGVRALYQAIKVNKTVTSVQEQIDFINNNLTPSQKADIAKAVLFNKAWQINQNAVKYTASPVVSPTVEDTDIKPIGSFDQYEEVKSNIDTLIDRVVDPRNARHHATFKYAFLASMVENGLLSQKVFGGITTGLKYYIMNRKHIDYSSADHIGEPSLNLVMDSITQDTPSFADIEDAVNKSNIEAVKKNKQEAIDFIASNIYARRFNQALDSVRSTDVINVETDTAYQYRLETFVQIYANKDHVLSKYVSRDTNATQSKDNYTLEDLLKFKQMLRDSGVSSIDLISLATEFNNNPLTSEQRKSIEAFQNSLSSSLLGGVEDIQFVGSVVANYIDNHNNIFTSTNPITTTSTTTSTITPPKVAKGHRTKVASEANTRDISVTLNPRRTTVFGDGIEGINTFENQANTGNLYTEAKEVAKDIKDLVMRVMKNTQVSDKSLLYRLYGQSAFGQQFLNAGLVTQVVATAYNNIGSISGGKATDEFLSALASYGCSPEMISYYTSNRILDFNTLATQLGKQIISQLGLKFNDFTITRDQLAMELGGLALDSLAQLGVIELQHISMTDVKDGLPEIRGLVSGGLPNSIKGVKINDINITKYKDKIDALNYTDTEGRKCNYLDETLGSYRARDEEPMDNTRYQEAQADIMQDYVASSAEHHTIDGATISIDKVHHVARVVLNNNNNNNNSSVVNIIEPTDTNYLPNTSNVVYLDEEQVLKNDDTYVEPERLLELARKQSSPKTLYTDAVNNSLGIFKDMSLEEIEAINDWEIPDNNDYSKWTGKQLKYKAIREYIEYKEPSTNAIGINREILRDKNKTLAIKAFKNWEYLKDKIGNGNLTYYFKEVNSVNNRSLVRGLLANYREDKACRPYYDYNMKLPTINTLATRLGKTPEEITNNLTLFAKTSILANFGFGYDKATKEQIEKAWDDIKQPLQTLISTIDFNNLAEAQKAIDTFNKAVDGVVELEYNSECITTLHYMKQMKSVTDWSNFTWSDKLANDWHIKFEVDGLTNGPAIKGWLGTAFLSKYNELSQQGRIAAGISSISDYAGIKDTKGKVVYNDVVGGFIDLKNIGANDTYLLNGEYVKNEVANRLSKQISINNKEGTAVNLFMAQTYVNDFKKDKDLNTKNSTDVLNVILSRNMLKPPTMVTNYGAGYKALINKMLNTFSGQASSLFAKYITSNNDEDGKFLGQWLRTACTLNGGPILLTSKSATGETFKIYLDSEGNISFTDKSQKAFSIFNDKERSKSFLENSTIDLSLNHNLATKITENFIDPMWDGMAKALEPFKRMDAIHGRIAQTTADMVNTIILQECKTIMDSPTVYKDQEKLDNAIKQAVAKLDTVLSIGAEGRATTLSPIRDSKIALTTIFNTLLQHKDGNFFLKNQVNVALKEGLASGLVPVSTHTMDSSIMHITQANIRKLVGETLGVHDALVLSPSQVLDSGKEINKNYWVSGIRSYETFAKRNKQFESNIRTFATQYPTSDLINQAYGLLEEAQQECQKIIDSRFDYLRDQIAKSEAEDRVKANTSKKGSKKQDRVLAKTKDTFNQYAFLNYTVFEPSTQDLKDELDRLEKYDPTNPNCCRDRDVGDFINFLNSKAFILCNDNPTLAKLFVKNSIASTRRLNLDYNLIKNHLNSVSELVAFLKNNTKNDTNTNNAIDNLVNSFNSMKSQIQDYNTPNKVDHSCNLFNSVQASPTNCKVRGLYNSYLDSEGVTVTNKNIIQTAYQRGIQKARALVGTRGITNLTGLITMLGSSSGLSSNELITFYELFNGIVSESSLNNLGNSFVKLSEVKSKPDTNIHVNLPGDKLNVYHVQSTIENSMMQSQGTNPLTLSDSAKAWFASNIEDQVRTKYSKLTDNDVVVFSMSSIEDILELQAIARMRENGKLNKDFKIAIQPNITDVDKSVNKDVQYTKKIDDYLGGSVKTWFARTVPNSNKNLSSLEYVLGRKLNSAYIEEGVSSTYVYSYIDEKGDVTPVKKTTPLSTDVAIMKTNEYGVKYQYTGPFLASSFKSDDFSTLDLRESGIKDMGSNDVSDLDVTTNYKYADLSTEFNSNQVLDIKTQLSEIKNHTMVFDVYADGSIIDNKVKALLDSDKQLQALKNQYEVIRTRRLNDYRNGKIKDRHSLLKPILVTTPASYSTEGRPLSAIFRMTIDNFVAPSDLKDLVSYRTVSSGTYVNNVQQINQEHPLIKNGFLDASRREELGKFVRNNQHSTASEVKIPWYLISPSVRDRNQQVNPEYDAYLDEFTSEGDNSKGLSSYVFFTKLDPSKTEEQGKGFSTLRKSECYFVPLVDVKTKNMTTIGNEANKSIKDILSVAASDIKSKILGKGYIKGSVQIDASKLKKTNDDKLDIASKQDLRTAMNKALADDKARGIETSHLEPLMGLVENLAMKIVLSEVNTVEEAGEGVITNNYIDKAVAIQYAKNNSGSSLEILLHEIMHGVFEHLHLDPSAQRQAMQLFKYTASNLKLEHFDCPKEEAERIMKYIFNDSSADNLQEFLAYAMTNSDFQTALNNMGIDKAIAKEFFTKTQSVTSRLFNTLCTNLDSDVIPTNMIKAVANIFNVTYANSQRVWEAQRQFDTLSLAEKEALTKHNGTVDRLLQESLSNITEYTGALIDRENFFGNAFGGNDNTMSMLTDCLRSLSENHLGFVHELATSLEAVSPRNYEYIRLRQKAKVAIDMQRERASSAINHQVSNLVEKLPTKVKHQLTKYLVQADVSCLFDSNTKLNEVDSLLKDSKARKQKIKEIEQELLTYQYGKYYINASKGLSEYALTGINPTGLGYRNAYEIASFAGSKLWSKASDTRATELVDKLTTLYSVDTLDKKDNNIYSKIPTDVLGALLELHNSVKAMEQNEVLRDSEQRYHIPKGQIHGGKSVGAYKVYPMASKEAVKWTMPNSITTTKLDPFFKGIVGDTKFITAHHSFRSSIPVDAGIYAMTDKFNGRVAKGLRVGNDEYSNNAEDLQKINEYLTKRINNLNTNNPTLINPKDVDGGIVLSFASNGNLIGANFELNPVETNKRIGRNVKFTNVIGDLFGSCVERVRAPDVNEQIAKATISLYDQAKKKDDFFWIKEDSTNEKERDYYKRIPYEAKVILKERFGDQGIPVPKSAGTIVLGKEALSSKKLDTEYYKAVEECRDTIVDYAKHLLRHGSVGLAEDLASYLTKIGKNNIVIKGLSVSINNILSNTLTLTRHGLSPIEAIRDQMEGVLQVRELEALQAQLNPIITKSLVGTLTTADIKKRTAIQQMMKKLPIYPLYSEGVLGSIVEDLDDSDSFIKDTIDKWFPNEFAKIAHFIANDEKATVFKLFKDLADIGDKAGKYALYKHQPDSMPQKEKLRRATETFIDYAIPLPTGFDMIERVGLQNFLKYPLGIQSELYNSLTQRPDDALKSLMIQASLGFKIPDAYGSLLGIGNFSRGLNFPGLGLFFDSLSCLPSARIANELTEMM